MDAKLFRNSGCESLIKSVLDKYYYDGDAVSVNGPIKSFRLTIDNHRNPGASKA
ncbi:hypothetical protein GGI20_001649 [Coemansia sp. BCRC 34301]|nr:hypothetical protein GGI20_001649 [Coemansia sp. BCRC 34301]